MKLDVDREAVLEIKQAAAFYEENQPGLGRNFLSAVEAAEEEVLLASADVAADQGPFSLVSASQISLCFDLCGSGRDHLCCRSDAPEKKAGVLARKDKGPLMSPTRGDRQTFKNEGLVLKVSTNIDPAGKYERKCPYVANPVYTNTLAFRDCDHIEAGQHSTELFLEASRRFLAGREFWATRPDLK